MMMLKDLLFMGFYVSLLRFRSTMRMPRYFSRRLLSLLFFFVAAPSTAQLFALSACCEFILCFEAPQQGKKNII